MTETIKKKNRSSWFKGRVFSSPKLKEELSDGEVTQDFDKRLEKKDKLLSELVNLSDEMAEIDSQTKDTSLHVACHKHYSDDLIIDVLLKRNKDSVRKENANMDLPLHSAMKDIHNRANDSSQKGVSQRTLETLISLHPNGVQHMNKQICLPIHIACENGALNDYAVRRLLKAYPESVMMHSKISTYFVQPKNKNETKVIEEPEDRITNSYFDCGDSLSSFLSPVGLHLIPLLDHNKSIVTAQNDKSDNEKDVDSDTDCYETDLSPLHLAILNNASPNIVDYLLNSNPYCLHLKTSKGRTALDIAKTKLPDSNDSIEVMKSYGQNVRKRLSLVAKAKSLLDVNEDGNIKNIDAKQLWRKMGKAVIFANRLAASLGPKIDLDGGDDMKIPDDFEPPAGLEHSCVDIKLPVGFFQLRRALMNSQSIFCQEFHESQMKCTE